MLQKENRSHWNLQGWPKRSVLVPIIILAMTSLVFGCSPQGTGSEGKELTPVVWAVDSFFITFPQRAAEELGYYEEEGVDIELRVMSMGADTMDAVIAGEADLGVGAHWALANRMAQPNIGLGGFIIAWESPVHLLAAPDIKTLSDLKGKRIGTITGTLWDWYSAQALSAGGLTLDDTEMLNFGGPPEYLAAAVRGDVDAAWFWDENLAKAREALEPEGWHSIATREDVGPIGAVQGHGILPINIESAKEKPEAIAGALRAYKRAADWAKANPDEAAEMAERLMGIPKGEVPKIMPYMDWYVGFPMSYVEVVADMKQYALDNGFLKEEQDYELADKLVVEPLRLAFPEVIPDAVLEMAGEK